MWVLLLLTAPAAAQRTVAVVDATSGDDAEVATLVGAISEQLDREASDALVPVAAERRPALIGAMPEEDRAAVAEVDAALPRARDALTRFDDPAAITAADEGLDRAAGLAPTPTLMATVADLLFTRGRARLDKDLAGAVRDFALVRRLDATRTLDPVKYLPEVLAAFERAGKPGASATLDVTATEGARVWIDGVLVGPAPASVTLAVGLHLVTVTGERLLSRGQLFDVPSTGAALTLEAAEASGTVITHRVRRRLIAAPDAAARADAVATLVGLAGAQDAIVVGRDGDEVVVWRYSGRTQALGTALETEGVSVEDFVAPLRPIRIPPPRDDGTVKFGTPLIIVTTTPWWKVRWVQATIGGSLLVGAITTVLAVVTRDLGTSTPMPGDGSVVLE